MPVASTTDARNVMNGFGSLARVFKGGVVKKFISYSNFLIVCRVKFQHQIILGLALNFSGDCTFIYASAYTPLAVYRNCAPNAPPMAHTKLCRCGPLGAQCMPSLSRQCCCRFLTRFLNCRFHEKTDSVRLQRHTLDSAFGDAPAPFVVWLRATGRLRPVAYVAKRSAGTRLRQGADLGYSLIAE